jgi:hypothetical protein
LTVTQQVGSPATCKNCLCVGASELNADQVTADALYLSDQGAAGKSSSNLATFSSRGPTRHDGRFKPDLVAPGSEILSMSAADKKSPNTPTDFCDIGASEADSQDQSLSFNSGTSMATPLVAGAMEYVRQYFLQGYYPTGEATAGDQMLTVPEALLRAVILAGSRQISGKVGTQALPSSYPNYAIGFGLPVVDRALFMKGHTPTFANFLQVVKPLPVLSAGSTVPDLYQFRCGASSDTAVHIVLTWTDPAGNPAAMNQIVNDLDLVVVFQGAQTSGNNGDFADTSNTVEKVALASCASGQVVRVAVNPGRVVFSQAYALAVNGNVEMGSLVALAAGSFSIQPPRLAPLKHSTSMPSSCAATASLPVIPARSPLGASPTVFDRTFVSRRVSAALAMYVGVSLRAFSATWSADYSTLNLAISCPSYVCGSSSSVCYVSAADIASALRNRSSNLALLPLSNPLSIFNWGNTSIPNIPNIPNSVSSASTINAFACLLLLLLQLFI